LARFLQGKRRWTLLGIVAAAALALPFAAAPASLAQAPASRDTITFAESSNIPTLDPAMWEDMTSRRAMWMIYDTLVEYNSTNTGLHPALAQRMAVSSDGLTYTFYLRPEVKFSNGDPLTAQDVIYSLNRVTSAVASASGPAPYGFSYDDIVGYQQWFQSHQAAVPGEPGMSGLTSPKAGVVQIRLQKPQAYFLNELALMSAVIVDPAVVQKYGASYQLHAVGTGPYKLQSWDQAHQLVLVANDTSWRGAPHVQKLVIDENVSPDLQLLRFERGQYDILNGPLPSEVYAKVLATPSLKKLYKQGPWDGMVYLGFNTTKPPFNNVYLRQAVNYALDKSLILRDITNGRGTVLTQPLPADIPGFNPAVHGYSYNVALAKQLVKKAGYQGEAITFIYPSYTSDNVRTAEIVQRELLAIGLNVHLQALSELGSYWPMEDNPKNDWNLAWTDWHMDYPDAQDNLEDLLGTEDFNGTNVGNWTNPTFQKLVDEADVLPPSQQAKRVKLYQQAEAIAVQQAAWGYLYYLWDDALVQPLVQPQGTDHDLMLYLHPILTPQFNLWSLDQK